MYLSNNTSLKGCKASKLTWCLLSDLAKLSFREIGTYFGAWGRGILPEKLGGGLRPKSVIFLTLFTT